jgi:prolycopene isomerase
LPPEKLAFEFFSYPFYDYLAHGGYSIKGGSQCLSDAIMDVIEERGGIVKLSSRVERILSNNNNAIGVTVRNMGIFKAKNIISNIAPHEIVRLLGKDALPDSFHAKLASQKVSLSAFQVFIGLNCPVSEFGVSDDKYTVFYMSSLSSSAQYQKIIENNYGYNEMSWFMNFFTNIDASLAPPGKSTVGLFTLVPGQ